MTRHGDKPIKSKPAMAANRSRFALWSGNVWKLRSRVFMALTFHDPVQGRIDTFPFIEKLFENAFAVGGKNVEAFVALVLFAPLADQESLRFQAAQQGIQGAFVDGHAMLGQGLAQGVTVLFGA